MQCLKPCSFPVVFSFVVCFSVPIVNLVSSSASCHLLKGISLKCLGLIISSSASITNFLWLQLGTIFLRWLSIPVMGSYLELVGGESQVWRVGKYAPAKGVYLWRVATTHWLVEILTFDGPENTDPSEVSVPLMGRSPIKGAGHPLKVTGLTSDYWSLTKSKPVKISVWAHYRRPYVSLSSVHIFFKF